MADSQAKFSSDLGSGMGILPALPPGHADPCGPLSTHLMSLSTHPALLWEAKASGCTIPSDGEAGKQDLPVVSHL